MTTAEDRMAQPAAGGGAAPEGADQGAGLSEEVRRSVEELGPADPQVKENKLSIWAPQQSALIKCIL